MSAVDTLQDWFKKLSESEKKEVVRFLYEGKALLIEGTYLGPHPTMVKKGLYLGPAPSGSSLPSSCPSCGRPY